MEIANKLREIFAKQGKKIGMKKPANAPKIDTELVDESKEEHPEQHLENDEQENEDLQHYNNLDESIDQRQEDNFGIN